VSLQLTVRHCVPPFLITLITLTTLIILIILLTLITLITLTTPLTLITLITPIPLIILLALITLITLRTPPYHLACRHRPNPRIPPRSIANGLWLGNPSKSMLALSLCGRLLTNPIRNKAFVVKLENHSDPKNRQRGCKGHVISFPQLNAAGTHPSVNQFLPRPPTELPDILRVIFVGNTDPTPKQLKKVFHIRSSDVRAALEQWRRNGHKGFDGRWSEDNMRAIAACDGDINLLIGPCVTRSSLADEKSSKFNSASLLDMEPDPPVFLSGESRALPEDLSDQHRKKSRQKKKSTLPARPLNGVTIKDGESSDDDEQDGAALRYDSDEEDASSHTGSGEDHVDGPSDPMRDDESTLTLEEFKRITVRAATAAAAAATTWTGSCPPPVPDRDPEDFVNTDRAIPRTLSEFYKAMTDESPDDPDNDSVPGDMTDESNAVLLESSGMVNLEGLGSDTEAAVKRAVANTLHVAHDETPVNQFDDPRFWADSFPVLFPYGCGGATETGRPTPLTLQEWVRHMLCYHDGRFRKDPSFIFVAFAILQTQQRLTLTGVLYKKVFGAGSTENINAPTSEQLQRVLDLLKTSGTMYGLGEEADSVRKMLANTATIGRTSRGSVYERGGCRDEILGMVTHKGLPNMFITVNPSDIVNPIVSFWNSTSGDPLGEFNLATLAGDFPSSAQRSKIVSEDSVLPALFFDTVIQSFLKAFFGYEVPANGRDGVLPKGKLLNPTIFTGGGSRGLKAFYGTVECQGRGSLHLHLLLWLEGIPSPEGDHYFYPFYTHWCHMFSRVHPQPTFPFPLPFPFSTRTQ
jgi:hypothetical protein